jgi:hypothetical protein
MRAAIPPVVKTTGFLAAIFIEQAGKGLPTSKTLASMDQAIRNFKLGQVSNPVDLSDF